jgi:hypothetical protein
MTDDQKYWFPAKRYGWGWGMPTRWQGWVVLIVWILVLFAGIGAIGSDHIARAAFMGIMLVILLSICYLKGEPLKWRWGK